MDFRLKEQLNSQVDRILSVVQTLKKEKEVLLAQINQLQQKNAELELKIQNSQMNVSKYNARIDELTTKINSQNEIIANQTSQIESLQSKVATQNNDTAEIENKLMEIINCLSNENDQIPSGHANQNEMQATTDDVVETVLNKFTVEDVDKESSDINKLLEDFQIGSEDTQEPVSDEAIVTSDQFNIDNTPSEEQTHNEPALDNKEQETQISFDSQPINESPLQDGENQQNFFNNNPNDNPNDNLNNDIPGESVQTTGDENANDNETGEISLFDDVAQAAEAPAEDVVPMGNSESQDSEMDFGALTSMFNEQPSGDTQPASQDSSLNIENQNPDNRIFSSQEEGQSQNNDFLSNISNEDYNPLLFEDNESDDSEVNLDLPDENDSEDDDNKGSSYNDGWADGVL